MQILDTLLSSLSQDENVLSVVLVGSAARGELTPYSDLDLHVVVRDTRPVDRLWYQDGQLVSVNFVDRENREGMLTRPRAALWNILPARDAQVLYDPEGWYLALQGRAHAFRWEQVQDLASQDINELLAGHVEEAHKILSGLHRASPEQALYAAQGLVGGMALVGALAHGALVSTENRYWTTVRDAEPDAAWRALFWQAVGMGDERLSVRVTATARLFVRSVELHQEHLLPSEREFVEHAAERVTRALKEHTDATRSST